MKKLVIPIVILSLCLLAMAQTQPPKAQTPAVTTQPDPQQQQVRPLLGQLAPPPAEWVQAYANEPIAQVYVVANVSALRQQIANLTAEVRALNKRLADLEKAAKPPEKPVDAVAVPVDKVEGKK